MTENIKFVLFMTAEIFSVLFIMLMLKYQNRNYKR